MRYFRFDREEEITEETTKEEVIHILKGFYVDMSYIDELLEEGSVITTPFALYFTDKITEKVMKRWDITLERENIL